jgi:formylglycine-generating enzyme required for sulfatase activity
MADVFISYSRKDADFVRTLTNALSRSGRDVWVDWQDIPRGENWLTEIFAGIERADAFCIIVSRHSLMSDVCNDEIRYALDHNKRIFPLILEEIKDDLLTEMGRFWLGKDWEKTAKANWTALRSLNWTFFTDDSRFADEFATFLEALATDLPHARTHTRYLVRALEWDRGGRNPSLLLFGDEITAAEIWLTGAEGKNPQPVVLHREYVAESRRAEDERQRQAAAQARRIQQFRRAAMGLGVMAVLAVIATIFAGVTTINAQSTRATVEFQATSFALQQGRAATLASGGVIVPPGESSPVPADFVATVTQVALLNSWRPVAQDLDGVEMAQVPPGCFFMGSFFTQDEQPVHQICFDQLFWIDRYEVTNGQFEQFGGQAVLIDISCDPDGDATVTPEERTACANRPRGNLSWYEARDYCRDKRGARLPTEVEWEYAARGPDSLLYPWGSNFVSDNVLFFDTASLDGLPEVGSRPGGASWIGAHDMSGSLAEWTSTIYDHIFQDGEFPYPYRPDDGREDLERTEVYRVIRGGHYLSEQLDLRGSARQEVIAETVIESYGFRCAH